MEHLFETLAAFAINRLGQAIVSWSACLRFREGVQEDACDPHSSPVPPPTEPVLPSPDYLEAMVGDLLEQQQQLKRKGASDRTVLLMTVWALIGLTSDVLRITLQNVSEPSPAPPKLPASDVVSQPPEEDGPD